MNIHIILCHLVKSLNHVVYEHILIERVTEKVKKILTAVNVSRVFIQSLTLVLSYFIEAVKTSLLNNIVSDWESIFINVYWFKFYYQL